MTDTRTDVRVIRDVLGRVLDPHAWFETDIPAGASYRTWRHSSDQWAVVLCTKGEMAGAVRATELDARYSNVQRFNAKRHWLLVDPLDVYQRLSESGAPDLINASVAVTA